MKDMGINKMIRIIRMIKSQLDGMEKDLVQKQRKLELFAMSMDNFVSLYVTKKNLSLAFLNNEPDSRFRDKYKTIGSMPAEVFVEEISCYEFSQYKHVGKLIIEAISKAFDNIGMDWR